MTAARSFRPKPCRDCTVEFHPDGPNARYCLACRVARALRPADRKAAA